MDTFNPDMARIAQECRDRQRAKTIAQAVEASRRAQQHFQQLNARYDQQREQLTGAGA